MKLPDWYYTLEPEVREIVYHLRNAGFNTTGSCGHKLWIELDISHDRLEDLWNVLTEYWGEFYIEFMWEGYDLYRQFADVHLGDRKI